MYSVLCWCTLSLLLQAGHTWIWRSPISLCGTSQAQAGWGMSQYHYFRSLQRCSIGLWLDRSKTFTDLSWSHSCSVLTVHFRLLSCQKLNLCSSMRFWVPLSRFSSRMSLYFDLFWSFPRILTSLSVPAAEKHQVMSDVWFPPDAALGIQSWFDHLTIESWPNSPLGTFWQTPSKSTCAFYWGVCLAPLP